MDSKKMIDIASLPMAESVNGNDMLLLMRQGENDANELMCVEKRTLTPAPAKKRVKRYVIGRAIALGSADDLGHENWYCYGMEYNKKTFFCILNVKTIKQMRLYMNGSEIELHYNEDGINGGAKVFISSEEAGNGYTRIYLGFDEDTLSKVLDGQIKPTIQPGAAYAFALAVDRVDEFEGEPLRVYLKMKALDNNGIIRSESTHYWFENGRRKWVGNYLPDDRVTLLTSPGDIAYTLTMGKCILDTLSHNYCFDIHGRCIVRRLIKKQIRTRRKEDNKVGSSPVTDALGKCKSSRRFKLISKYGNGDRFSTYARKTSTITGVFIISEYNKQCGMEGRSVMVHIGGTCKIVDNNKQIHLRLKSIKKWR